MIHSTKISLRLSICRLAMCIMNSSEVVRWTKQSRCCLTQLEPRPSLRFRSGPCHEKHVQESIAALRRPRETPFTEHNGHTSAPRTLDPCTKPPHLGGIAPDAPSTKAIGKDTRSEMETNIPIKESVVARELRLAAFVDELVKPMICYKKRACNVMDWNVM
jgi:hypothetical protein